MLTPTFPPHKIIKCIPVDLVTHSVTLTLVHHSLPRSIWECGIYSSCPYKNVSKENLEIKRNFRSEEICGVKRNSCRGKMKYEKNFYRRRLIFYSTDFNEVKKLWNFFSFHHMLHEISIIRTVHFFPSSLKNIKTYKNSFTFRYERYVSFKRLQLRNINGTKGDVRTESYINKIIKYAVAK